MLAERNGYDALWASGLGISTVHGLADSGILTMTELFAVAREIARPAHCR